MAHKAVTIDKIANTNVNSKLVPNGKTINLQRIPNKASFGMVEIKAKTDVSVPLYTSIIQFAKGNIASLDIKPNIVIMLAKEYSNVASFETTISYISEKFKLEVKP